LGSLCVMYSSKSFINHFHTLKSFIGPRCRLKITSRTFSTKNEFPKLKVTEFENGLKVASLPPISMSQTATIGVWLDAGSVYENEKNNGIAYFLKNLALKGTKQHNSQEIENIVDNMGGRFSGYNSRERTVFYVRSLKEDTGKAVSLLNEILQSNTYSQDKIEMTRKQVLDEINQIEKSEQELLFDYLHSVAYSGTPLASPVVGLTETVSKITGDDILDFKRKYYRPNGMVLVGVGVEHDTLVKAAKDGGFANLSSQNNAQLTYPVRYTGSEVRFRDDDIPMAYVAIGFKGAGLNTADYFPLQVLQQLLGSWHQTSGGDSEISSRLAQIVTEEGRPALGFSAFNSSYKNTGLFGVYFVSNGSRLDDMVYLIEDSYVRVGVGVKNEQVMRARNQVKTNFLQNLNSSLAVSDDIGSQLLSSGTYINPQEFLQQLEAVDASAVRKAVMEHMYDTDPVVASLGNIDTMPDYTRMRGWTYWLRV